MHAALVAIVKLTPTPKDDAIVAKVYDVIVSLASILSVKRKDFPEVPPKPGLY